MKGGYSWARRVWRVYGARSFGRDMGSSRKAQLARRPLSTRTHILKSGHPLIPHPPPPLAETEQPLFSDNTHTVSPSLSLHCSICFSWIVQAIAPASPSLTLFSACVPDCRALRPSSWRRLSAAVTRRLHDAYAEPATKRTVSGSPTLLGRTPHAQRYTRPS